MSRRALLILAVLPSLAGAPAVAAQPRPLCLSASDTLEAISSHKLIRPGEALAAASRSSRAEAVGAKLCRSDRGYIYEITLLRADGKVLRVGVDAATGRPSTL